MIGERPDAGIVTLSVNPLLCVVAVHLWLGGAAVELRDLSAWRWCLMVDAETGSARLLPRSGVVLKHDVEVTQ